MSKTKKVVKAMKGLLQNWNQKADEYAAQVTDGLLTADEAAKCLAGADLKKREEVGAPGSHGIEVARQAIDSRLSGYAGLVIGRHV